MINAILDKYIGLDSISISLFISKKNNKLNTLECDNCSLYIYIYIYCREMCVL